MKAKELRERKSEELAILERDLRRQLGEGLLKFRLGASNRVAEMTHLKRDIARILTIRRERG